MEILLEINEIRQAIDQGIAALKRRGIAFVEADNAYKVAYSKKLLEQREAGVPVTIIENVCKGFPDIAKLLTERNMAEMLYKVADQYVMAKKAELKVLQDQYSVEFRHGSQ